MFDWFFLLIHLFSFVNHSVLLRRYSLLASFVLQSLVCITVFKWFSDKMLGVRSKEGQTERFVFKSAELEFLKTSFSLKRKSFQTFNLYYLKICLMISRKALNDYRSLLI